MKALGQQIEHHQQQMEVLKIRLIAYLDLADEDQPRRKQKPKARKPKPARVLFVSTYPWDEAMRELRKEASTDHVFGAAHLVPILQELGVAEPSVKTIRWK